MTDALHSMKDAPRDGTRFIAFWKDTDTPTLCKSDGVKDWWTPDAVTSSRYLKGWLPLPADASSKAVAETAGTWLSKCEPIDKAIAVLGVLDPKTLWLVCEALDQTAAAQEPSDD